jgi:hypothetical protein
MQNILKFFLFFLLIAIPLGSSAQEEIERIERQFRTYDQLIRDTNIDEAITYVDPRLFEFVNVELLKASMKIASSVTFVKITTSEPNPKNYSSPKLIDGVNYVRFENHVSLYMQMIPDSTELAQTPEWRAEKAENMYRGFEAKFGKGNVDYDATSDTYTIRSIKIIIASSDAEMTDWKFVVADNPRMKEILRKFIPEELLY